MKREDVLKVDELKEELTTTFREFERGLKRVFGELVYAIDTVVDRYNALDARMSEQQRQFDAVSARLLAVEKRLGGPQ